MSSPNYPQQDASAVDLAAAAEMLVDAEVTISLTEWLATSPRERAAISVARRAWRARRAVHEALAAGDPVERALAIADEDGGEALEREELRAFHEAGGPA